MRIDNHLLLNVYKIKILHIYVKNMYDNVTQFLNEIFYDNILGNIILSECDTANKSHNGVVKFRRYYLGKTGYFTFTCEISLHVQFMLVGTKRTLTNVEIK